MKAAIFDLDGTLLDTLEDLTASVSHALAQCGFPQRRQDEVRNFLGNGYSYLLRHAAPAGIHAETEAILLSVFKRHYEAHCLDRSHPYAGVPEMLRHLRNNGVHTAIVSNKGDEAVKALAKRFFADMVDIAIGERPGIRRKPHPDMVFEAMRHLGTTPGECLYIGDSEVDFLTAAHAGLPCISCLWGFRDEELLREVGAQHFVHNSSELLTAIWQLLDINGHPQVFP